MMNSLTAFWRKRMSCIYQVLLLPSYYENVIESSYLTLLKKKMIDGILLTSHTLHPEQILALSKWGKIVCCEACSVELVPSVFPDRFAAYIEVFTYLKNKGYKRIHFTSGRDFQSSPSTRLRIQAYQETITEAYENQFFDQCFDYQDGKRVGDLMFRNSIVPDAIFTNGDEVAAGISFRPDPRLQLPARFRDYWRGEYAFKWNIRFPKCGLSSDCNWRASRLAITKRWICPNSDSTSTQLQSSNRSECVVLNVREVHSYLHHKEAIPLREWLLCGCSNSMNVTKEEGELVEQIEQFLMKLHECMVGEMKKNIVDCLSSFHLIS